MARSGWHAGHKEGHSAAAPGKWHSTAQLAGTLARNKAKVWLLPHRLPWASGWATEEMGTHDNTSEALVFHWLHPALAKQIAGSGEMDYQWLLQVNAGKYAGFSFLLQASDLFPLDAPNCSFSSRKRLQICDLVSSCGTIPPSLRNLSQLQYLDLSNCFAKFSQIDLHWLPGLSSLRYLNLGGIDLSKDTDYWLHAINSLPSLTELRLPNCFLSKLPLSLPFINVTSLEVLDLSNNNFNSSLPQWLFNLTRLVHLDLNSNSLGGELPDKLANLASLQELDMSQNSYLEGRLPKSLGSLCDLSVLKLSVNKITGKITDFINGLARCNDSKLENLDLGNNKLFGNLPDSLGNLKKLRYLNIRSCQLGPEFPTWLKNQNDLRTVVMNNANISGTIPNWFFQLNLQLDELNVGYNRLTGEPPTSLMFVDDQSNVYLRSNLYEGPLPMWSSNVTTLYLDDNRFSGPIPPNIGKLMPYLTDLDLSRNDLNGTIPLSIGNMATLTTLVISNNYLSGKIPRFWSNLPFLYILDMSNNSLSDLSHNRLSGSIPPCIGNLTGLKVELTDADTERYQGRLTVVAKGRFVQYDQSILYLVNSLDLSDNCLSGEIPKALTSLVSKSEDGGDDREYFLLILSIGLGFFVGFWGVCGTLIVKKSWREAYYNYVDKMKNKLAALITCRTD
ncbi:hypothetical protein NL676_006283 [Syzygium grande]|nr:hypothetical protein NL676_006283 [Syzygium grande]